MSQECMLTKETAWWQLQDPREVEMSGIEMSSPSYVVLRSGSLLTWACGVRFPLLRQHVQRWRAAPVRRLLWLKSVTFSVSPHEQAMCFFRCNFYHVIWRLPRYPLCPTADTSSEDRTVLMFTCSLKTLYEMPVPPDWITGKLIESWINIDQLFESMTF